MAAMPHRPSSGHGGRPVSIPTVRTAFPTPREDRLAGLYTPPSQVINNTNVRFTNIFKGLFLWMLIGCARVSTPD